jgi:hypothetical protein
MYKKITTPKHLTLTIYTIRHLTNLQLKHIDGGGGGARLEMPVPTSVTENVCTKPL